MIAPNQVSLLSRAASASTRPRDFVHIFRPRFDLAELSARGLVFEGKPQDRGFGVVATMVLPGDVKALLYEAKHKTAI